MRGRRFDMLGVEASGSSRGFQAVYCVGTSSNSATGLELKI